MYYFFYIEIVFKSVKLYSLGKVYINKRIYINIK